MNSRIKKDSRKTALGGAAAPPNYQPTAKGFCPCLARGSSDAMLKPRAMVLARTRKATVERAPGKCLEWQATYNATAGPGPYLGSAPRLGDMRALGLQNVGMNNPASLLGERLPEVHICYFHWCGSAGVVNAFKHISRTPASQAQNAGYHSKMNSRTYSRKPHASTPSREQEKGTLKPSPFLPHPLKGVHETHAKKG